MKTLFIVRHAKSSWDYESVDDIDRPLKEKGIKDAHFMATVLFEKIERPDIFVSSCAIRALHTAVIFTNTFKFPFANLKISKSLYNFKDGYLAKTVRALDDGYNSAIIFSHNHGINDFVNQFGDEYIKNVPTCGVVSIEFDEDHWKNIKKGKTILKEFPKFYSI
ncbi:MAG: histidine phosphatase family protein [Flavobacteriales bacterium CG03_land_8_20_14_0_80_35_15]|nr:histidine phosphatase family protein [Zetaproteobacteria bacterium]OIO09833.1 MAG: histidine phosphatase family protein [Flavobacteriaceae bacterium CG1_02_35_72]PIV17055.1 MAG: histidine phosphatase family protein [Flavobacteriales bacterium CG03_land_8_20_14_0_80_35_15]PIX05680.1 MAG: histidine phosphatase family protein [Flavobacteriales bacterium CG_4_8_14_3_um_filter_35_10]PJA05362.1 MAG: histidine phosphatase family protein [Flavobacteriales bacterium CG_4_10_14_0_2_um_filter_35_18]